MMKKLALNFMKGLGSVVNFLLLFSLFFIISTTHYAKATFGDVSLPQLLFFTFYGGSDGVESTLVYDVIKNVFVVPCLATVFCLVIWKKTYNGKTLFCSHWFFLLYIAFLAVVSWVLFYKVLYLFEEYDVYRLVALMFGFYLLNLWRNYNLFNIFIVGVFGACLIIYSNYYGEIWRSLFSFKQTDFYEKNFKAIDDVVIKKDVKRNVIVIFAESFENRHAEGMKDDEAVKFSNLTEGFSQNWTQGALFSLFTGVHIHYLSEFFRYGVDGFKFNVNDRVLMATNEIGQSFGFDTPNISYLGDITRANGYNNLFVQGGKLNFSGTDKFLFAHGFLKENVYDMETFKGTEDYEKAIDWWGVSDKNVFQLFKDKLLELEDEKPFFAVMFTLDLHRGFSPFYEKESEQAKATVENLNDFIKWFKEQELNKNTTLIIVGDHKRMGNNVSIGGDVYNAFFNLPDELKKDVNLDRTFNQIDMFATILDIIGVELNEGRAAVGVSVFSKNKTIAERYSYEKQKEIFSKIDRFYQKIWEEKKPLFNVFWEKDKKDVREKFIAHAGGCIDGNVYTNSLEAMEKSKKRGYKYIELDLITTDTPPL
ncbi:MAG: sulfatase-like hydrolase/transferase [Alphaproteobacteria bacterium]|nr:sulfatase-like hydrolase/transferase [Alphaproteobacteria bacterium]